MKLKIIPIFRTAIILLAMLTVTPAARCQDWGRLIGSVVQGSKALSISDSQVAQYVHEYIQYSDKENNVLPASDPYSQRLARITQGINQIDGIPLNFAVYRTDQINAFACADGSVRVYTGLLDLMTDDEVLGVIGHEIGHVAHHDTRNAFKQALLTQAFVQALGSAGGTIQTLTDSQLAQIGQTLLSAKYSRKQEEKADDYGYAFLVTMGRNPVVMAQGFAKLMQLEQQAGSGSNMINQLFSDHPDTAKRIKRILKQAKKDGFKTE